VLEDLYGGCQVQIHDDKSDRQIRRQLARFSIEHEHERISTRVSETSRRLKSVTRRCLRSPCAYRSLFLPIMKPKRSVAS